jgi:hypothetical protein
MLIRLIVYSLPWGVANGAGMNVWPHVVKESPSHEAEFFNA